MAHDRAGKTQLNRVLVTGQATHTAVPGKTTAVAAKRRSADGELVTEEQAALEAGAIESEVATAEYAALEQGEHEHEHEHEHDRDEHEHDVVTETTVKPVATFKVTESAPEPATGRWRSVAEKPAYSWTIPSPKK